MCRLDFGVLFNFQFNKFQRALLNVQVGSSSVLYTFQLNIRLGQLLEIQVRSSRVFQIFQLNDRRRGASQKIISQRVLYIFLVESPSQGQCAGRIPRVFTYSIRKNFSRLCLKIRCFFQGCCTFSSRITALRALLEIQFFEGLKHFQLNNRRRGAI